MRNVSLVVAMVACSAMFSAAVRAQDDVVKVTLSVKKVVVDAGGKEVLQSADLAQPGDVLEYTAAYVNTGKKGIRNLEATLPIPVHTGYQPDSAKPSGARASWDLRVFEQIPLKRIVKREHEADIEQVVPYSEYRLLRWYPGHLGAGEERRFSTRVRVENYTINLVGNSANITVEGNQ